MSSRVLRSRNLKEAGLTRRILRKLAIKCDEACRQEFKNSFQNHSIGDGSVFVVLDETSKNETHPLRDAHVNPGTREACRGRPAHIVLIQRDFDYNFSAKTRNKYCHVWLKSVEHTLGNHVSCKNLSYVDRNWFRFNLKNTTNGRDQVSNRKPRNDLDFEGTFLSRNLCPPALDVFLVAHASSLVKSQVEKTLARKQCDHRCRHLLVYLHASVDEKYDVQKQVDIWDKGYAGGYSIPCGAESSFYDVSGNWQK
ncbi:hypothetical protein BDR06DRAFT_967648 [Suillus hirtellus]|nr:hypothetical protein BDR06DRAFT_967648 [Suillus hirtellus]